MEPFITIWVAIAMVFGGVWGTMILRAMLGRRTKDLPDAQEDPRLGEVVDDTRILASRLDQVEEELAFLRELRRPDAAQELTSGDPDVGGDGRRGSAMRRFGWGIMVVLAAGVTLYALVSAFIPGLRSPFVADMFAAKAARSFGHLFAGGVAMFSGALQFSSRIRWSRPATHRLIGKIYMIFVVVSGVAALLLAPVSDGGVVAHWGFGMLAVLWLGTSFVALSKARSGDFGAHREWMIRSFALCLAAVTLRIYLPISQIAGVPFPEAYPAIAWLCWVPNLIVAEWFVIRSSIAPMSPPSEV